MTGKRGTETSRFCVCEKEAEKEKKSKGEILNLCAVR